MEAKVKAVNEYNRKKLQAVRNCNFNQSMDRDRDINRDSIQIQLGKEKGYGTPRHDHDDHLNQLQFSFRQE